MIRVFELRASSRVEPLEAVALGTQPTGRTGSICCGGSFTDHASLLGYVQTGNVIVLSRTLYTSNATGGRQHGQLSRVNSCHAAFFHSPTDPIRAINLEPRPVKPDPGAKGDHHCDRNGGERPRSWDA